MHKAYPREVTLAPCSLLRQNGGQVKRVAIEANILRKSLKALDGSFKNLTHAQKIRIVAEVLAECPPNAKVQK